MNTKAYRFAQLFALAFWLAIAALMISFLSGCAGVDVSRHNTVLIQNLPQPMHSVCPELYAVIDQMAWNKTHPNDPEDRASNSGKSMLPLIPDTGSFSVIRRIPYEQIKPGMIVVYKAKWAHSNVQHVVSYKSIFGYAMEGLNNDVLDPEYVTPENYVGVTVAIFD